MRKPAISLIFLPPETSGRSAIEKRTAEYDAGKVIKSHSAGSESISFEVGKNKLDAILTSQEKQNMYLLAAAEEYLQNVSPNLFYRGYE